MKIIDKNFLSANEVKELLCCSKSQAYKVISNINKKLNDEGVMTFQGKVLAEEFYSLLGLSKYSDKYEIKA